MIKIRLVSLLASLLLVACTSRPGGSGSGFELLEIEPLQINSLEALSEQAPENHADTAALDLVLGEVALNRGDTKVAIEHYLKAAKSQNNPKIAERAVRIAVYGQDLEAAVEAAHRWIELAPKQTEAHQIIAAIYIRQDKADQAYNYLDDLIQASKLSDEELFLPLLGILSGESNAKTVLWVSRRIADKYPSRGYAQFLHGRLSAQSGAPQQALEYLDKALVIEHIVDAYSVRARILMKLGKPGEAIESLYSTLNKYPKEREIRLTLARILVDIKQYDKARKQFEILHKAAPGDAELLFTLGILSLDAQRLDDAEKYMMMLVRMKQREGEAEYYLGRVFEYRKQYKKSIAWFSKVHIGNFAFDARLRSAEMLGHMGRTGEAVDHIDAMLKGSQSSSALIRIYSSKGQILRQARRFKEALDVYTVALGILPNNTDLLYARALVAEKIDRIDILETDLKAILKAQPDNAHALNALGFTLADRTDRLQEALGYIKRAIEIMPDDPAVIDSMGWIEYRLGNYKEAVRLLRKAVAGINEPEIAAHLGEALWASGRKNEAKKVWTKALKDSPNDRIIQRVMKRFIP